MILYFSGTGNCKYVAERIAEALSDTTCSIEAQRGEICLAEGEVFGLVTPVYFWELPPIVRDYLTNLTVTGVTYSFAVVTYGTTPGCCGEDAKRSLAKKGISLSAAFSIKMPDNWTPWFDLSDPEKVAKQNEEAEAGIEKVIGRVKRRETGNHTDRRTPYVIRAITDLLLNNARKTKNFHLEDKCVGCGICADKCPVQAIEMKEGKPIWVKKQCTLCLRCLHHCPVFAIQYGNGKTKEHGQYRNPHVKI